MEDNVKRGSIVQIKGVEYEVPATENYVFFVRGKQYIVLWSDEYRVIKY